ncbi:SIR2 family protein [Salinarimonas sp.]|uniref:SIR2 family protein n=1 Tax=Salinarimonas sp. TaxID=2766526 RepID=UPI0032D8FDEB
MTTESKYYEQIREQLRYWPYMINQLDETLDIALIEGRARQILFQALNARSLTAFVGSGTSAAYGRLSWPGWEREQLAVVTQNLKAFEVVSERACQLIDWLVWIVEPVTVAADREPATGYERLQALRDRVFAGPDGKELERRDRYNVWRWLRFRRRQIENARKQVEQLSATFQRAEDGGDFPGGEGSPVKFEIAQQLQDELQRHVQFFMPARDTARDRSEIDYARAWPGSWIDDRSAAPENALSALRALVEDEFAGGGPELRTLIRGDGAAASPAGNPTTLADALQAYGHALADYFDAYNRPEAGFSFETLAKLLLADECAHALITLRQGFLAGREIGTLDKGERRALWKFERELAVFDETALRRDIAGIREKPERYEVLAPFRLSGFSTEAAARSSLLDLPSEDGLNTRWEGFLDELKTNADSAPDGAQFLTPTSRFVVAVLLALHEEDARRRFLGIGDGTAGALFANPLKRDDFKSRRSIIAEPFDPLSVVVDRLGIKRFITLNYDFEIERFFVDAGYRHFPPRERGETVNTRPDENDFRNDAVGRVLRDQTFTRARAADLVGFSVAREAEQPSVFHLHGRATRDDPLVVTERNYMNLYLREDEHSDTVSEGITTAFSSTPLIFLGLGMRESDLLRPLRQFMSNRDRTIGYNAIALLPAEESLERRTQYAAALYMRYGVHTIFYGGGEIEIELGEIDPATGKTKKDLQSIDWLARISTVIRTLSDALKRLEDREPSQDDADKGLMRVLIDACGTLGDDLGPMNRAFAFMALCGEKVTQSEDDTESRRAIEAFVTRFENGRAQLRICTFTPVRRSDVNRRSPHYDAATAVDGTPYVGFYVGLLDQVIRIACAVHARGLGQLGRATGSDDPFAGTAVHREIAALRIALDGLRGSMLTAALCAALDGIEREWRSWWEKWQHSPPRRLAKFEEIPAPTSRTKLPRRHIRHLIESTITRIPDKRPAGEPFMCESGAELQPDWKTGVRAFDTFVCALAGRHRAGDPASGVPGTPAWRNRSGVAPDDPSRRLLITVAAQRGLGKGTFTSAFVSPTGLTAYCRAAWPEYYADTDPDAPGPRIHAAAFVNLSFSTEIASCFDMIVQALIDTVAALEAPDPSEVDARGKAIKDELYGLSRLTMLRRLSERFSDISRGRRRGPLRFLLVISALDLFYKKGKPKNAEIGAFLDFILGEGLESKPFDVVIVAAEHEIGAPFTGPLAGRPFLNRQLDRARMPDRAREQIAQRLRNSDLEIDHDPARGTGPSADERKGKPTNYVHFARGVNPITLMIDNFPVLAAGLYLHHPPYDDVEESRLPAHKAARNAEIETLWGRFGDALAQGRDAAKKELKRLWERESTGDDENRHPPAGVPTSDELDDARRMVETHVRDALLDAFRRHFPSVVFVGDDEIDFGALLRARIDKQDDTLRAWREMRRYLIHNRHSLTMLLAAAEHVIVRAADPREGVREAESFLLNTANSLRNIGEDRREGIVLQEVLACYQRYHEVGDAEADIELHKTILRHLGVIGAPLSSAVIVRLPRVRDHFDRIGVELETSRRRVVARALTTLAYRGLVFRLTPHVRLVALAKKARDENEREEEPDWPASREYRYALHRIVQRYAVSMLGTASADSISTNGFAPTLYTSMPSSGAQLTPDNYGFIRQLLIATSQYPDLSHDETTLQPWPFASNPRGVRAQALRAALSLARSALSVSTISRFSGREMGGATAPRRGYMETYKVRLRWIIRLAWELANEREDPDSPLQPVDRLEFNPETDRIQPLYRDEIVWLYNEIGVIALVQGSLTEALGFLRQAAEYNEGVEGRSRAGPIFDHIDFNHALVQLERGQLVSAEQRLARIVASAAEPDSVLHLSAQGYLCVLRHVTGRFEGLAEQFRDVTEKLQRTDDLRASALLLGHRGRFLGARDRKGANACLRAAQALAETGGHEDVRHHIEIARIATAHRFRQKPVGDEEHDDARALARLKEIEAYGRRMDIWSIQADALRLRAEILLRQGETATAGSAAIRALAICRRTLMTLRMNATLTLYGEILLQRQDRRGANELARQSLELAKATHYNNETSRAQALLSRAALGRT